MRAGPGQDRRSGASGSSEEDPEETRLPRLDDHRPWLHLPADDQPLPDVRVSPRELLRAHARRGAEHEECGPGRITERARDHDLSAGVRFADQPQMFLAKW